MNRRAISRISLGAAELSAVLVIIDAHRGDIGGLILDGVLMALNIGLALLTAGDR